MPGYLIHIGPHKTGTTYLQASFGNMRSFLSDAGIIYPEHWQDGPGHFRLVQRLKALDESLLREFADLNRASTKLVLISAEDLSDLPKESIEFLRKCIDGRETTVVGYCRRWSELLASGWQEMVKHGELMTFTDLVAGHVVNIHASRVINYDRILLPYADAFGKANLRLVSYSELMDCGKDLLSHFLETFLGVTESPPHQRVTLNASMGILESELIRSLNSLEWAAGESRTPRPYRAYLRLKPKLELQQIFQAMERAKRCVRMNEGAASMLELHRQLVTSYGSAMVPPRPDKLFFAPRFVEMPYIGCEYLMCDGVMDRLNELRELFNRTDSSLAKEVTRYADRGSHKVSNSGNLGA